MPIDGSTISPNKTKIFKAWERRSAAASSGKTSSFMRMSGTAASIASGKELEQLTKDHSLRRELISRFQLSEERASALPFKNVLTRAVGTSSQVEPDIAWTNVLPQDIYILCSDGLTDALSDQEIAYILYKNPSLKNASEELVEQAKINGSTDNITLVMIKIL